MAWLWYVAAAVVGGAGVWLAYRSLLGDRARGRRRCGKCWYDLGGSANPVGQACPECGRVVRTERQLRRTRRRWGRFMLAVVVLALAFGAGMMPRIQRDGWEAYAPTVVLAAWMPRCDDPADRCPSLLAKRLDFENREWIEEDEEQPAPIGGVTAWMLTRSAGQVLDDPASTPAMVGFAYVSLLAVGERASGASGALGRRIETGSEDELWQSVMVIERFKSVDPVVRPLASRVEQAVGGGGDEWMLGRMIQTLGRAEREHAVAVAALRVALRQPQAEDSWYREPPARSAIGALGEIGADARVAIPDLLAYAAEPMDAGGAGTRGEDAATRIDLVVALGKIDATDAAVREFLVQSLLAGEVFVCQEAARLVRMDAATLTRAIEMLEGEMAAAESGRRVVAAYGVAALGSDDARLHGLLRRGAEDADPVVRRFVGRALGAFEGKWADGAAMLERLADDEDPLVSMVARRVLEGEVWP